MTIHFTSSFGCLAVSSVLLGCASTAERENHRTKYPSDRTSLSQIEDYRTKYPTRAHIINGVMKKLYGDFPANQQAPTTKTPPRGYISVVGQVRSWSLLEAPPNQKLTLSRAIWMAGGLDKFANSSNINIISRDSTKNVFDLFSQMKDGKIAEDYELKEGDLIIIPEVVLNM
jgi:protein involved in polysaccharide export with SLBB domain